ncbi:hypothetical protein F4809DRAFT_462253 [Biscogniauxia mediterranea]|nr:hypothetical protein F4809DRAFT_462253 [Biscogniauxia mediterranea]
MSKLIAPYRTGQILCSRSSCTLSHVPIPAPNTFPPPKNGWPDLRGLDVLQSSSDRWLNFTAIENALVAYTKGLPRELQLKIQVESSGISTIFNTGPKGEAQFDRLLTSPFRRFVQAFRAKEYTLWPVSLNSTHWVLLVIHKGKSKPDAKDYDVVRQVGYYDPWRIHNPQVRRKLIYRRLQALLTYKCKLKFLRDWRRDVWVPVQHDGTSCGPRAYWSGKTFLDRLLTVYEAGQTYDESLWNPHSGWFNENFVRGEMIGRIAWLKVAQMEYKSRLSIELINEVNVGTMDKPKIIDAGLAMKPVDHGDNVANWPKPDKPPVGPVLPKPLPTSVGAGDTTVVDELLAPAVPSQPKIAPKFNVKAPEYITLEGNLPPVTKEPVFAPGPKNKNLWLKPKPVLDPSEPAPKKAPQPQPQALLAVHSPGSLNLFSSLGQKFT